MTAPTSDVLADRRELLADVPVEDVTIELAGVDTSVLIGGTGAPIVLLHGPAEHAATWLPVLDDLAESHRVIVPDLPGHGGSDLPAGILDRTWMEDWLAALLAQAGPQPPVLVGRVTGGALAARFVAAHPGTVAHLVLVDTTGLAPFDPDPRFGLALRRYLADPTTSTFARVMDLCAFDLDAARSRLGDRWARYADHTVALARTPRVQAATGSFLELYAAEPLPADLCASIDVPTTLIWGAQDLATPVRVAQAASRRHGWALHVIDGAGDDPPLDQPDAFVEALLAAVTPGVGAPS
jgi:pimeloyl-ACP methyl ester carboxylesterase